MFLICALVVAASIARATDVVWVDLLSEADVRGLHVTLADVAAIDALDDAVAARLRRLEIGRIDDPSRTLVFGRETILRLIGRAGVDAAGVRLGGAARVVVRVRSVKLPARRIASEARRAIEDALGAAAKKARIEPAGGITDRIVPAPRYRIELVARLDPNDRRLAGLIRPRVTILVDGESHGTVRVPFFVHRSTPVVVVRRRVARGRPLTREDLEVEIREVSKAGGATFASVDEVLGMLAQAPLVPGQVVTASQLRRTPVVRRNDVVTARIRSGSLAVETVCRARQDGAPGDRILLENVESRKTIYAVVIDSRTVEVRIPNSTNESRESLR